MKKLIISIFILIIVNLSMMTSPALAVEGYDLDQGDTVFTPTGGFHTDLSFLTDLLYRGLTYTRHRPAVKGNIYYLYNVSKTFYLIGGVIGANVSLPGTTITFIYYGVIGGNDNKFSWSITPLYWAFPYDTSARRLDYFELMSKVGYNFGLFKLSIGLGYSPAWFSEAGVAFYPFALLDIPITKKISVFGELARQTLSNNTNFAIPNYTTWFAGVQYAKILGFVAKLEYVDTSVPENECFGGTNICDSRVVASITRSI